MLAPHDHIAREPAEPWHPGHDQQDESDHDRKDAENDEESAHALHASPLPAAQNVGKSESRNLSPAPDVEESSTSISRRALMQRTSGDDSIVVVGGGLGGLACAAYLARAGRSVTVLERAAALGGRARTTREGDFYLNLGPHALYRKGAGTEVLAELEVRHTGGVPKASGGCAIDGGA